MTPPDRIRALARIQQLREQRQFAQVAQASAALVASHAADLAAAEAEQAALDRHHAVFAGQTLCLDQLGLAKAVLSHAGADRAETQSAVATAQTADQHARAALQQEKVRTSHLADKARTAERRYANKLEERQLAAMRSLRAALEQGEHT